MFKYVFGPFLQKYQHLGAYFSYRDAFHLYKHSLFKFEAIGLQTNIKINVNNSHAKWLHKSLFGENMVFSIIIADYYDCNLCDYIFRSNLTYYIQQMHAFRQNMTEFPYL